MTIVKTIYYKSWININDKDDGGGETSTAKRKSTKRKNLLGMLESKAENNFKLNTEELELERRKLEFDERKFDMQMEKDRNMLGLLDVM